MLHSSTDVQEAAQGETMLVRIVDSYVMLAQISTVVVMTVGNNLGSDINSCDGETHHVLTSRVHPPSLAGHGVVEGQVLHWDTVGLGHQKLEFSLNCQSDSAL